MLNQKHRWTTEEENALLAGVDKYGTGKWMKILSDEDFAPFLIARSNVDLKDKWRNLCGSASRRAVSPRCSTDNETDPWYNTTILEPLPSPDDSYGLDMETIYSHLENVVDEAVQEVEVKEEEVDTVDEVFVQDYSQVLREVSYEEHEIYVALEHAEELDESPIEGHVESAMSMNIEGHPDACLVDDTQESTMKPKLLLKLVFKALKKLKTSVQKMMLKILRICNIRNV